MKFVCTSDWQAGVTTLTLEQQEPVWHQIVDLAIDHDVAGVLHAGDLLEGPTLSTEVLAAVRRVFARLRDVEIPVLLIRGNGRHDLATRDVDGIDLFHDYDGIEVSQRPGLIHFGGAYVVTLPWVSPKHLVASLNGTSRDNVYEATAEHLLGIARDLRARARDLDASKPAILMLHWSVSGATLPTGLPVDQIHDVILPWPELDALGFDAIVCGHIHKPQNLGPHGFYCGSPQPLNHGETGAHGVWIIDIGEGTATQDFVALDAPQFVTIDAPSPDAVYSIPWGASDGDIVRVRVTATREQMQAWSQRTLREALLRDGASRVTIEPNIIREVRARAEHLTESLTELDALMAYCQAQQMPEELFERMHARTGEWL